MTLDTLLWFYVLYADLYLHGDHYFVNGNYTFVFKRIEEGYILFKKGIIYL